jgi:DNA-binding transcriptional LysR family regulator
VILALPSNNPLARKRGPIDPRALKDEIFVSTSVGFDLAFKQHVEAIASLGGFEPKVSKRARDLTTVLTYVSSGYGIAAISAELVKCQMPNVTFKEIASSTALEVVYAFMHRTNESAPASKALIEAMRAYALKNLDAKHDD